MASQVNPAMEKAWNDTCRVLFGEELGPLSKYEEWLRLYLLPTTNAKSASGKETNLTTTNYLPSSTFASFDEVDFSKKYAPLPLSINEIKDIDGIAEACRERFAYAGNIILGNSSGVERSSNVIDSHFVCGSNIVSDSKYVGFCTETRYSDHCFGCYIAVESSYAMKSGGGWHSRAFECHLCQNVSDSYYCTGAQDCRDCMFTFGTRNGRNMIGNLALPREKYLALKKKLVSEIASKLKSDGRVFSLFEVISLAEKYGGSGLRLKPEPQPPFKPEPLEKAFSQTCSLLFGRKMAGIEGFAPLMRKNYPDNVFANSPLTGRRVAVGGHIAHLMKDYGTENRMLDQTEAWKVGGSPVAEEKLAGMRAEPEELARILFPVAYAMLDTDFGNNANIKDATIMIDSSDCLNGSSFVKVKKCAYCHWPRESEGIFGSNAVFKSSFCINCYFSTNLTRSFECDNCENCADGYFLHNCENVNDSMFCFNVKNLRNAIGNSPLPPEKFKSVKSAVISQLADELEKKKDVRWTIYNVGAKS
ncbi:MAG: hypothetical protein NT157_03495 [Candidatus Micrarchaeota archaeon]|nr:hypothetical protein [Candidatus Micrarchaeota archaeon]